MLGAAYMLRMVQNVFLGPFDEGKWHGLTDINLREVLTVAPLMILTLWIGMYPKPLNILMTETLQNMITLMAR